MELKFTKMHGCGNDYIYVDCTKKRYEKILDFSKLIKSLCKRRFSVGADGIILICNSEISDAKMIMYNKDGSLGMMCGNGIRCVAKYLYDVLKIKKENLVIETASGLKNIKITAEHRAGEEVVAKSITVNMGIPEFLPERIPVNVGNRSLKEVINYAVNLKGHEYFINCVSMGNPHCVLIFEKDIRKIDLEKIATDIYDSGIFPEGVNIEVVNIKDEKSIDVRVWERGSRETLACGTGACACYAVLKKLNFIRKEGPIDVNLKGGTLSVFRSIASNEIFLSGPAQVVYTGVVEV